MRINVKRNQWIIGATAVSAALWLGGLAMAQQDTPADKENSNERTRTLRSAEKNDDYAMARRWQKADDLTGKKVVNATNEDLGKLEDIVVDANSGRILYGVLSFGGILGIGDKLFAIPWRSLTLGSDDKEFILNIDKETLKNAEGFDKKHWPNFANERWATMTHEYYKQTPYWRSEANSESDMSRISYRDRWNMRAVVWQKTSDLTGKDIHNNKNEDLGRISDLVIDPDQGRVIYGVLTHRSRLFAIPWNALSLSTDAKMFVLNVDKQQLTDAISFTKDRWPNFIDNGWANENHRVYHVQPYWRDENVKLQAATP